SNDRSAHPPIDEVLHPRVLHFMRSHDAKVYTPRNAEDVLNAGDRLRQDLEGITSLVRDDFDAYYQKPEGAELLFELPST
mgnify:CR=1